MPRHISQREARRLRVQLLKAREELEAMHCHALQAWPRAVNICTDGSNESQDCLPVAIRTARKLGHAVFVVADDDGKIRFYATPLPAVTP